jgi:hypothetical protein
MKKIDGVAGGSRKPHSEDHHNSNCSLSIIKM